MDDAARRQFFRESLRSVVRPLAAYLERRLDLQPDRAFLRPPGALSELAFLETCYRCGNCVESCPADAIRLLPSEDENLNNTPIVDPDISACVICDELACMKSCPSGALQLVDHPAHIRMGLAEVHDARCVRSQGEDCTICIERCPLGTDAIRLDGSGAVEVLDPGCVGCGVCQFYCPTLPKAITVSPR